MELKGSHLTSEIVWWIYSDFDGQLFIFEPTRFIPI